MIRLLALILLPFQAQAVTLDLPANATLTLEEVLTLDSYAMPIGPWTARGVPVVTGTGEVRKQAWRIGVSGLTTLQLLAPLQDQLIADGFEMLFTCTDDVCGGFDFRFATPVLPAPAMYVDLGNYRFSALRRITEGQVELMSLLASRSAAAGFVQVIRVGSPNTTPVATPDAPPARAPAQPLAANATNVAEGLETAGRFALTDLVFATGSSALEDRAFASLRDLSDYLTANPNRTVALVGHTDAVGSLEGNIALSKRRAASVMERLIAQYGVPPGQLRAEGMGYLAPIATNLTEDGRDANRRVEVILLSTD